MSASFGVEIPKECRPFTACYDCGRDYEDPGFQDLLVPDEVWKAIGFPGQGGLLCSCCLARRCVFAGIECEAVWASGPFAVMDPDMQMPTRWTAKA